MKSGLGWTAHLMLLAAWSSCCYGQGPRGITGHPYSAEEIYERTQTLADGTHITQTVQDNKLYRDSSGRTRTEHVVIPPPGMPNAAYPTFIDIVDPVAGYHYSLNENSREARRTAWPPQPPHTAPNLAWNPRAQVSPANPLTPSGAAATTGNTAPERPRAQNSTENLGTQTIDGIVAVGRRETTVYPQGFFGNDRPLTVVREQWYSPDLSVTLLEKTSDPRMGESTRKLINISQSEPDPSLFQVPANYTIVEDQPVAH